MKKIILIIALITLNSVFASTLKDQCVQSICSSADKNINYNELASNVNSESSKEITNKMINILKETKKPLLEIESKKIDILIRNEEIFSSMSPLDRAITIFYKKIIPSLSLLYTSGKASPSLLSSFVFFEENYYDFFISKGYTANDAKWTSDVIKLVANDFPIAGLVGTLFSQVPEYAIASNLGEYKRTNYNVIAETLNELINPKQENSTKNSVFIKSLSSFYFNKDLFSDLSSKDIYYINLLYVSQRLINIINNPSLEHQISFSKHLLHPPTLILEDLRQLWTLESDRLKELFNATRPSFNNRFDQVIETSKKDLLATASQLPNSKEILKLKEYIKLIKDKAVSFTKKNVSHSFATIVKDKISTIQFDLPLNKESLFNRIESRVHRYNNITQEQLSFITLLDSQRPDKESTYPFNKITNLIADYKNYKPLYDYSVSTEIVELPSVKVSWATLKYFNKLKDVVAHEIGHILFHLIRGGVKRESRHTKEGFENLKTILSCISSVNPQSNEEVEHTIWDENGDYYHFPIHKYAEEDFADQFAAYTNNESSNYACTFLEEHEQKYIDLSFINSDDQESHSAPLLRLLNIQQYKNQDIDSSCERSIESETFKLIRCFK